VVLIFLSGSFHRNGEPDRLTGRNSTTLNHPCQDPKWPCSTILRFDTAGLSFWASLAAAPSIFFVVTSRRRFPSVCLFGVRIGTPEILSKRVWNKSSSDRTVGQTHRWTVFSEVLSLPRARFPARVGRSPYATAHDFVFPHPLSNQLDKFLQINMIYIRFWIREHLPGFRGNPQMQRLQAPSFVYFYSYFYFAASRGRVLRGKRGVTR